MTTLPTAADLKDHGTAIAFGLDHLAEFDLPAFLRDVRSGKDLQDWIDVAKADREFADDIA